MGGDSNTAIGTDGCTLGRPPAKPSCLAKFTWPAVRNQFHTPKPREGISRWHYPPPTVQTCTGCYPGNNSCKHGWKRAKARLTRYRHHLPAQRTMRSAAATQQPFVNAFLVVGVLAISDASQTPAHRSMPSKPHKCCPHAPFHAPGRRGPRSLGRGSQCRFACTL